MKFIKNIFKSKVDLDGDGKLESYRQEMEGVFSEFQTKVKTLEEVEVKYRELIQEEVTKKKQEAERIKRMVEASKKKQAQADKRVEKAEADIEVTAKLRNKLKEFIM
jgi:vacuolar-type H+-ATPase subunit E/Vma4